ncbi:MAG: hypothetical protein ACRC68_12380 [Clostridium sp.]
MDIKDNFENMITIVCSHAVGELYTEIDYNIHFVNNQNVDIYNLRLPVQIPKNTKYKDDSLYVNGNKHILGYINNYEYEVIPVNSTIDISYTVVVISVPLEGLINNTSNATYLKKPYDKTICKIRSNIVTTTVKNLSLIVEKNINNIPYYTDDIIQEDIVITNKGNIKVINLLLDELTPENILVDYILLNNSELIKTPNIKNIPIGNINPGKSIKITWYGKVLPIANTVNTLTTRVLYNYYDHNNNNYMLENIIEKSVVINLKAAFISINQVSLTEGSNGLMSNCEFCSEVTIYNEGNIDINTINMKLIITEGVDLIYICARNNLVEITEGIIENGINLPSIKSQEELVIICTFRLKNFKIKEKKAIVLIDYAYLDENKNILTEKSYTSNESKLICHECSLENPNGGIVKKTASKSICKKGEVIEYKIQIRNVGKQKINKMAFVENENYNAKFIKDSFRINNKVLVQADIYDVVYIGDLEVGEIMEISYNLEALTIDNHDKLMSLSYIDYFEENIKLNRRIEIPSETIQVISPKLEEIYQETLAKEFKSNDLIPYNVVIQNLGNIDFNNITINLTKPDALEVVKVTINNELTSTEKIINNKLNISNLNVNNMIKLEILYKFKIDAEIPNSISLGGSISYNYDYLTSEMLSLDVLDLTKKSYQIIYGDFKGIIKYKTSPYITGDLIECEIAIENLGNIDLYDIEIEENEDNNIKLIESDINPDKINRSKIKSTEEIIIPIKLRESDVFKGKLYTFSPKLKAKYKCNDEVIILDKFVNEVTLELVNEDIQCKISSDKTSYMTSEVADFNIVITNRGSHSLEDSIFTLELPKEIDIVDKSIYIGNNIYSCDEATTGIPLKTIASGETIIAKYAGSFKDKSLYKKNYTQYKLEGYYNIEISKKSLYKEYFSDVLENSVEKVSLKVFLNTDKELLLNGDSIKYSSTIINDGTVPLNIKYSLVIGDELDPVKEFTKLDGKIINNNDDTIIIEPNDGACIEKEYIYKRFRGMEYLSVYGMIDASYSLNNGQNPGLKKINTEVVETKITNTTFKELIIEKTLEKKSSNPNVHEVLDIYVAPKVIDYKIKTMYRDHKYDCKELLGYRLDILGRIEYTVEYLSKDTSQSVFVISGDNIFTATMLLPDDFLIGEDIKVIPKVLDVHHKIINNKSVFIIINLLINTSI